MPTDGVCLGAGPWILANTTDGAPSREMASLDWASITSSGAVVTLTSLRWVGGWVAWLSSGRMD